MTGSYEPGGLVDLLEINVQNFETDFETHWGINSDQAPGDVSFEDWILARKLDAVGREILTTVHALALTPTIANALRELDPAQDMVAGLRDCSAYNILRDRADIVLGWGACRQLYIAKDRLYHAIWLVSRRSLSDRAAAFLDRAIRSYLWGFDPECVVMCRAVLDAALQTLFDDARMRELGYPIKGRGYDLKQRIDAAYATGQLNHVAQRLAHQVRIYGNDTVHLAPGAAPKAFMALAKLGVVLDQLFPDEHEPKAAA